jgi:hypothetical protein
LALYQQGITKLLDTGSALGILSEAQMIETNRRFEAYQAEVQAISQLGISFHEWLKLTPSTEEKPDKANLMYIIPEKPLDLPLLS